MRWYSNGPLLKALRDFAMLAVGLGSVIHEVATPGDFRPILAGIVMGLVGTPYAMREDDRRVETVEP